MWSISLAVERLLLRYCGESASGRRLLADAAKTRRWQAQLDQ
jgi:hypothetical protein